ncbi:MAG: DUF4976 domain-containing protein [Pedosphaera sp.]|nr:DUF4976 domain-containing protein [Pedosphaera sp.]
MTAPQALAKSPWISLAALLLLGQLAESAPRPNVLMIFSDDHAYQAIGAYGSKINKTPHLDRIAKEGMRFDRCVVNNSICGPSRAAILTGKYSHKNGFYQNGDLFDGAQQTFPKLLQKSGYQTAMFGKWHLSSDPTGFDHWEVLIDQGPYYNPPMKSAAGVKRYEGYTTEIITDRTLGWLKEQRDTNKPFMLFFQHKAPHRNWQPGPKYLQLYKGENIPEPSSLFDDHAGRGSPSRDQDMSIEKTMTPEDLKLVAPKNLTPAQLATWNDAYAEENEAFAKANLTGKDLVRWKYQRYIKDYLRCVAAVDDNVGRVLEYLDQSGLAKDTLVIYSSDQGFFLGEHGWFDKRWMYEESFRTPLLVRWPGVVKPGSVTQDIVANIDLAETILDAAGAPIPADMQGRSFVPLLKGQRPADWRKSFYYHYYEFPQPHRVQPHYGVTTDRYKLIHFYNIKEWELYDLQKDPGEMKSVYADPAYAKTVVEMKAELVRQQKQLGDDKPDAPPPPRKAAPKKGAK